MSTPIHFTLAKYLQYCSQTYPQRYIRQHYGDALDQVYEWPAVLTLLGQNQIKIKLCDKEKSGSLNRSIESICTVSDEVYGEYELEKEGEDEAQIIHCRVGEANGEIIYSLVSLDSAATGRMSLPEFLLRMYMDIHSVQKQIFQRNFKIQTVCFLFI